MTGSARFDLVMEVASRLAERASSLPAGPRELTPMVLLGRGSSSSGGSGGGVGEPDGSAAGAMPVFPPVERDAAVLVLLYPDADGETLVLLTERTRGDYRHSGEVSFPGGVIDPDDESIEAAALREAREEVGLDVDGAGVRVVARLDPVEIRVTGFRLTPVLAVAPAAPHGLAPDPREVATILEVPLRTFLPGAPIEIVETEREGFRLRYGAFPWGEYRIWGATARVLGQLGAVLGGAGGG